MLESVPTSDWYISLFAILIIALLLILVEIALKYFNFAGIYTRKFVHIFTGLLICFVALFLKSNLPIILFATSYIFVDLWALKKGKFKSIHPDKRSYGTLFYAISVLVLAVLFWGENKPLFIITNLIMVIPDAMAALLGEQYARQYFIPLSEKKSVIGAITMYMFSFLIVFVSMAYFYDKSIGQYFIIAFVVSAVATVSELISYRGSDNLSVPLLSGLYLYTFILPEYEHLFIMIVIGTILAALVAVGSWKIKFLDPGGASLAFLMGSIIFGFGGWSFTFPILGFFILSSLLSKIGKSKKRQIEVSYQKTGIRDFQQALANGGVAMTIVLIVFFSGNESLYLVYLVSIAAATADTWGTELGIFSKSKPVLITNFKSVEPGTSGGITLMGSTAAVAGSMLIILIGSIYYELSFAQFIFLGLLGFTGSIVDSLLGATIQGQYICKACAKRTESKFHCNKEAKIIQGYRLVDNDFVNIFSIAFASIIAFFILH
jgi:uncharacterized protein (TIGR00297 family)